jgi:ABC-type ATPase involved in cell division/GNAT superfamily N-acetyltransferase
MVSARVRAALAPFGVTLERDGGAGPRPNAPALHALGALPPGSIALITGASGGGKSTLLRALGDQLDRQGEGVRRLEATRLARSRRRVIDLVPGRLRHALGALARAGLGEAGLLARRACELSEGERWRLALAIGIARGGTWLLADEFCSVLDRETARGVCAALARWVRSGTGRLVAASAHADLAPMLGPDLCVRVELGGATSLRRGLPLRAPSIRIEPGGIEDYDALASLHYRSGRPATWTRVLRTVSGRRTVGVLVESRPTLNAAWRDLPWPGRFTRGDKRARARRLNRELRCISRVVVDPRWRSMGVARRLVEAALSSRPTPGVEAVAAMGAFNPFFERAGMIPYPAPVSYADARLGDALEHAGLSARDLIVGWQADRAGRDPLVRRELRRWAGSSRATRRLVGQPWGAIARAAGVRLAMRPVCYAFAG